MLVVLLLGCSPRPAATPPGADQLRRLVPVVVGEPLDQQALDAVSAGGDRRLAWFLVDLLRFAQTSADRDRLVAAFTALTGVDPRGPARAGGSDWARASDHLIAADLPAPRGYRDLKAAAYLLVEPRWRAFFDDDEAAIDWRLVTWGGVFIDDRGLGDLTPCSPGCIPALDDPGLTDAAGGAWYGDGDIVFTVVVDGAAVAFPKHIMEVHEMVNITVGGRRLGIPYCTLCGSAQAYLTDAVRGFDPPVLRTTGLLSRSNKVTYDLGTGSVIDTFTGRALSGPLHDAGVTLEQVSVGATTWGAWKAEHPETLIVAEDGGIGRAYDRDPLRGRDADGPIFPVGPVDPRLPAQHKVVGVVTAAGTPVAFPAAAARSALRDGRPVAVEGVRLVADGGALTARDAGGTPLVAHESFWFAWSQFHPDTLLWTGLSAP